MKDIHTYREKMARNGRTKDIYKGTFVCIQTLLLIEFVNSVKRFVLISLLRLYYRLCLKAKVFTLYQYHVVSYALLRPQHTLSGPPL